MQFKIDRKIFATWPDQQIRQLINQALKELKLPAVDFIVEHPVDENHGDYSSNIALQLFSKLSKFKNPRELAKKITDYCLQITDYDFVDKIEIAGPGFLNFHLKREWLLKQLNQALKQADQYGRNQSLKAKKVMVEFTDPNPFKEFHIGHLYSNAVGESLARLFEAIGAQVKRANYQGDVGMHVAKSIWGMKKKLKILAGKSLTERVKFMGQAYAAGATAYQEDQSAKKEIEALNKQIYEQDPAIQELYQTGRQWSLDYFETIYKRLGTKFDEYFFESEAGEYGLKIVQEYLKKGVFAKSKGAVIFEGEKRGLHTRVFINSLGLPTYEAKDLGLAVAKYQRFKYDYSFNVTGNEINAYFQVVLAALKQINPELWQKTRHVGHGMVRLPEGKMSSRTGKVLTGEWLIDEAKAKIKKTYPDVSEKTAEMVAIGAIKYALLKAGLGRDVIFSFKESISLQGNSGPYLQYTYARCRSVLQKTKITDYRLPITDYSANSEELAILRWFYRYPETVLAAAQELAPNQIANYLYELAQRFNTFYNNHRIVGSDFRLTLTAAIAQILENGLYLLGIKAPEKM
ncbi:arginine--tRNA ligase [Patescibacteria group bacterium]|nr:arginine--tRNA ligase [Patescibacteria group bacterium]MBU1931799.1 arginine--tRNA ligase [Patescibacteria group bacterium]